MRRDDNIFANEREKMSMTYKIAPINESETGQRMDVVKLMAALPEPKFGSLNVRMPRDGSVVVKVKADSQAELMLKKLSVLNMNDKETRVSVKLLENESRSYGTVFAPELSGTDLTALADLNEKVISIERLSKWNASRQEREPIHVYYSIGIT